MWAVTGLYFAFPAQFRAAVNSVSPVSLARTPQSGAPRTTVAGPGWRALIDLASHEAPGQHVARVVVPANDRAPFLVMFSSERPTPLGGAELTSVYLDQYSGAVLSSPVAQRRTSGDAVMAWVAPLHVGNFGGFGVKVAWLLLGLAPPLMFVTGFIMWWTRNRRGGYG